MLQNTQHIYNFSKLINQDNSGIEALTLNIQFIIGYLSIARLLTA